MENRVHSPSTELQKDVLPSSAQPQKFSFATVTVREPELVPTCTTDDSDTWFTQYNTQDQDSLKPGRVVGFRSHRVRRNALARSFVACPYMHCSAHKNRGRQLLMHTSQNDLDQVGDLLRALRVDVSSKDDKGRTALHIACTKGLTNMVKLLLDFGANPNVTDAKGNTPLHLMACTSHVQIITILLKAGADVNLQDQLGNNPLSVASNRLQVVLAKSSGMREEGASPSLKEEVGQIVEMMETYMKKKASSTDGLEEICQRLQSASTNEDLHTVSDLLSEFHKINLT